MTLSLSVRGWIALFAALGSTTAAAQPTAGEPVALPNAADPKPAVIRSQEGGQMVVISLERPAQGASASGAQAQRINEPANKRNVESVPFHKPKGN